MSKAYKGFASKWEWMLGVFGCVKFEQKPTTLAKGVSDGKL